MLLRILMKQLNQIQKINFFKNQLPPSGGFFMPKEEIYSWQKLKRRVRKYSL